MGAGEGSGGSVGGAEGEEEGGAGLDPWGDVVGEGAALGEGGVFGGMFHVEQVFLGWLRGAWPWNAEGGGVAGLKERRVRRPSPYHVEVRGWVLDGFGWGGPVGAEVGCVAGLKERRVRRPAPYHGEVRGWVLDGFGWGGASWSGGGLCGGAERAAGPEARALPW
jgi:hypothetical protein